MRFVAAKCVLLFMWMLIEKWRMKCITFTLRPGNEIWCLCASNVSGGVSDAVRVAVLMCAGMCGSRFHVRIGHIAAQSYEDPTICIVHSDKS